MSFNLDDLSNVALAKPAFGKRGYRETEVDAFIDRVARTLRSEREGIDAPTDAVNAVDVHHIAFHKAGFGERGYDERTVDDLLDEVEQELDRLAEAGHPEPTVLHSRGRIGPDQVHNAEFNRAPFGKRGYDEQEVDLFLDRIEATLRGTETLTAEEIRDVLFNKPPIGRRGYNEDQVDAFLDRVISALSLREAS